MLLLPPEDPDRAGWGYPLALLALGLIALTWNLWAPAAGAWIAHLVTWP
jgi:hypothetical protein